MAGLRISLHGSKELQAVVLRLKTVDREIATQINKATRAMAEPVWKEAVRASVTNRMETRVLSDTARVSVSRGNVTLKSATIGKSLAGGTKPYEIAHAVEFGADRESSRQTLTSKKRHTKRQFRPRNRKGYVVYPAAAEVIPRIASLWAQTVVRTLHEVIEGK
ncbi:MULTISPECIES: hypothetical protein [unclassified Frondihabitans]|uniref:hypothetical protein n=1 Tax=unclassified Frondihabitans TaxID=2626248 RepID=UPI000F505D8C|nr:MULTISPECIES: hypothetical protein [unclassified Frondihabitans]RPE75198.1 hypothetical protein EDF37_2802 [Frondihabitans sp. PhB153]RPF04440.1 hypothetical protein EDF39_2870 [Frondihabitans sp. PhB161]